MVVTDFELVMELLPFLMHAR